MISLRKSLAALILASCLLFTSCSQPAPSRFDDAQQQSTNKGATAVVDSSKSGSAFNRYFPDSSNEYERVYSQEKKGFAQAKLKKDGAEVAILSISDTLNSPSAANKFQDSSEKINGYPAVSQGSSGTVILVGDRYQVKIRSKDPAFGAGERQEWLGKFDLRGLSKLK
ncbi:MAG: hypothetical protein AAF652_03960 [Cyanobacteria bacterium P01_C01_bin.72]